MKKIIKRTVVGLLVLLFGLILILVPSSIQSSDQLKNVESTISLSSMVESGLQNATVGTNGLSTEITINSKQFNQLLKSFLTDNQNQELLESAYSIEGDKLRLQLPIKILGVDSKLDLRFHAAYENHTLRFDLASSRLGNLPVPKAIVASILQNRLKDQSSNLAMEQETILVSLPESQFKIIGLNIQDNTAKVKLTMNVSGLLGQ
ncbi:hypothetical protein D8809_02285 [Streptococcus gordonii]|mgnify:FL=1|uniref:hypothetical protein n=1 Tax=Streptococcus gordonii TaxID=1302 RepID=UPI000F677F2A|nr:hypothetical protein [Streptococcus gordonii]RSK04019.1 hypothetical protein D8809_02285 [Streptococcus gordonii]